MGIAYKTIMWLVPDALFLIAVLAVNVGIVLAFIVTAVNVTETEGVLAMHRLHFSPNGISVMDDDTSRVYPGLIDSGKFINSRLDDLHLYDKPVMTQRLAMFDMQDGDLQNEAFMDQERHRDWVIIARATALGVEGKGISTFSERRIVTYNGEPVHLETYVLMPR